MKPFPFLPQLDETDCGAACLAMVAKFHGKRLPISRIRELAGTDRIGTNILGLVQAAEKMGFLAKALKGTPEQLDGSLPLPLIAHIKMDNLFHFVVVYRISKDKIWVADPGPGLQVWSREKFSQLWTGTFLVLLPDQGFEISGKDKGPLARFYPLLWPFKKTIIEVVLVSFLLFFFGLANFFYFRFLVDDIIPGGMETALHAISIGMIFVVVFNVLLGALRNYFLTFIGNKIDLTILFAYFRHVLTLPLNFFDTRKVGEVLTRLDDVRKIRSVLSGTTLSVIMDVVMMFGVGAFLFFQSPQLALLALITVPFSSGVVWSFAKPFKRKYQQLMGQEAQNQAHFVETFNGIFTIKSMNAEALTFWKAEQNILRSMQTGFKLENMSIMQGSLVNAIDGMGSTLLFWLGGWFILQGDLTLGQLISFNALMGYFTGPLKRLITLQPSLQEAFVAATRLGEILDLEPEQTTERTLHRPEKFQGNLVFEKVRFRYGTRRYIFEDLSFQIKAGERIGLVGGSGAGKSTLVKLIMKFYKPEDGIISIDSMDLRDIDISLLRDKVGYVPQEVNLFSGTVRENIALHHPTAPFEAVLAVALRAQAHDFISRLPDRYETLVGERGANLSGGERQRLALARALLGQPEILILDEATSALDSITERAIQQTIDDLSDMKITTLIIAHRLSTVAACDRILVLDQGCLAESGTHEELLKNEGLYSRLWAGQTR